MGLFVFSKRKPSVATPARVIVVSFLIVIVAGAILLSMPFSSKTGTFTSFLDCLFTATSATCVTGLIVFDTFTKWTVFGQLVILAMIQIGGLGLVTLTTFFNIAIGKKLGLRSMQLAQESVNSSSVADVNKLVKMIVGLTFSIEAVGALILTTVFVPKYGMEGIYIAIFLAVSAFCNAGFDVLGREGEYCSLMNYAENPVVLFTIAALIIVGGLGFIVWKDLIAYRKNRHLLLHTKIVLVFTGILLVIGTVGFMIFEWGNPKTMTGLGFFDQLNNSFFQSVTCRTAGFDSINQVNITNGSKILSCFLMFIGAAPGSTGGGIKVTTLAVIAMTVVGVARNREETIILKRRVPAGTVYRAITITMLALLLVSLCSTIIYLSIGGDPIVSGLDAFYESVSAFATVGLSVGVSLLSGPVGRILLILLMFIGRVGPVALLLSLAARGSSNKKQIMPEAQILVG